jgi:type II secretion system protein C
MKKFILYLQYTVAIVLTSIIIQEAYVEFILKDYTNTYSIESEELDSEYNFNLLFDDTTHSNHAEMQVITDIVLKGLYSSKEQNFAILYDDETNENTILDINQSFKGYKLISVKNKSALFEKNGQEYNIPLMDDSQSKINSQSETVESLDTMIANIKFENNKYLVPKNLVVYYINKLDILLEHINLEKNIDGFIIKSMLNNSAFNKLGLQENDIIKQINNQIVEKSNDWFVLQGTFQNSSSITVQIIRNSQPKELKYEIY